MSDIKQQAEEARKILQSHAKPFDKEGGTLALTGMDHLSLEARGKLMLALNTAVSSNPMEQPFATNVAGDDGKRGRILIPKRKYDALLQNDRALASMLPALKEANLKQGFLANLSKWQIGSGVALAGIGLVANVLLGGGLLTGLAVVAGGLAAGYYGGDAIKQGYDKITGNSGPSQVAQAPAGPEGQQQGNQTTMDKAVETAKNIGTEVAKGAITKATGIPVVGMPSVPFLGGPPPGRG